jgi:hypothetical protein
MAVVDQKERYRRQAALCYEIATKAPKKAASMVRLGDTYSALEGEHQTHLSPQRDLSSRTARYAEGKCGSPVRFPVPAPCRPCRHFAVIVVAKL